MKKVVCFVSLFCCLTGVLDARIVRHTVVSTREEKVHGIMFKQVIVSGSKADDTYCIDGYDVSSKEYQRRLQAARAAEHDEQRKKEDDRTRRFVTFQDEVQKQALQKMVRGVILQTKTWLDKLSHDRLKHFYAFDQKTIASQEQLDQIQAYLEKIEKQLDSMDYDKMNQVITTLEPWEQRLEEFYQESVRQGIDKSDRTQDLKALLQLVG